MLFGRYTCGIQQHSALHKRLKGGNIALNWKPISELQSVTCHMGSHGVTCHPTWVNTPCLNPSQIGWYSIYLPRRDGKLSWPKRLVTYRDGLPACRQSPIAVLTWLNAKHDSAFHLIILVLVIACCSMHTWSGQVECIQPLGSLLANLPPDRQLLQWVNYLSCTYSFTIFTASFDIFKSKNHGHSSVSTVKFGSLPSNIISSICFYLL